MIVFLFEKETFSRDLYFYLDDRKRERKSRARSSGGQQWIVLETEGMIHME
jgi:hypothetical protein